MGAVTNATREVLITTSQAEPNEVCLGVPDIGPGLRLRSVCDQIRGFLHAGSERAFVVCLASRKVIEI
jgi:hypothetical protein